MRKAASSAPGLPHSGHSGGVSGSSLSSMVLSTSTKGTSATIPANRSGARLADRAHEHAARAAAMGDDASARRVACIDQGLAAGDEIRERVRLLLALAIHVPAPALLGAAADMRDRIDESAVDEGQDPGAEARRHRHAIGAVAVEQAGRRAVESDARAGGRGRSEPALRPGPWRKGGGSRNRPDCGRSALPVACAESRSPVRRS